MSDHIPNYSNDDNPQDEFAADQLWRRLWAKSDPPHDLWRHLLDAAAVCRALIPRFGRPGDMSEAWLCYLVALHDIGKADPLFQFKLDTVDADAKLKPFFNAGLMANIKKSDSVGFRHEARSAKYLGHKYNRLENLGWGEYAIDVVQPAINGHHGDFSASATDETEECALRWNVLRDQLATVVASVVRLDLAASPPPQDFDDCGIGGASAVGLELSALIVLLDWIASNHKRYRYTDPKIFPETSHPAEYWKYACREAELAVACLELDPPPAPEQVNPSLRFADIWPAIAKERPSQRKLDELVQAARTPLGLVILEAPMGEGKTEAAIYLSEVWRILGGRQGAYIALPTQATSNQLHERYRKFLWNRSPTGTPPRLVHGMAWLVNTPESPTAKLDEEDENAPQIYGDEKTDDEPVLAREWFQSAKRALLAPEGVGTVDQAMFGALNVKHGFLRLYGLTTKTLVIDECHAYDAYMTSILCRLLSWCRALEIPVILLSATLSRAQKSAFVAAYSGTRFEASPESTSTEELYPLLTFAPLDGSKPFTEKIDRDSGRNVNLGITLQRGLLDDPIATACLAYEQVQGGGCAGVIVNTVRSAQAVYKALEEIKREASDSELDLTLFHARFRAIKRADIETEVTGKFGKTADGKVENPNRPDRGILVATQVAEQSLDIDLDVLLTSVAPIDLLLQRAGRMHRHEGRQRPLRLSKPVLHVLLPAENDPFSFGTTQRVYARELLLRTLALLLERPEINLPEDFRRLIEGCYSETIPQFVHVPAEEITVARKEHLTERQAEENAAGPYLISLPRPEEFTYAHQRDAFDEAVDGDGKPASYLRARTRLGDETRSVIVLQDRSLLVEFDRALAISSNKRSAANTVEDRRKASRWSPHLDLLRRLFLQKANVPIWWLPQDVIPAEGVEPILDSGEEKIGWLRFHAVLRLNEDGEWRGFDANGKPFTLRDDPTLGLTYEGPSEKEKNDATV